MLCLLGNLMEKNFFPMKVLMKQTSSTIMERIQEMQIIIHITRS